MNYLFLIFLFAASLFGQNATPAHQNKTDEGEDLDKEFYTYYYMNLPKYLQPEDRDKKKIQTNILRVLKKEIIKRDHKVTKEEVNEIKPTDLKIKRVSEDSPWIKLIKKEMKYINFTDYMFIAKYKKYLIFVLYTVDPEKHLITPTQVEYLKADLTEPAELEN